METHRNVHLMVDQLIKKYALHEPHLGPTKVLRALEADERMAALQEKDPTITIPSRATIASRLKLYRAQQDRSYAWNRGRAGPDEVRIVDAVKPSVAERTGKEPEITTAEAKMLVRLHSMAERLPTLGVWYLAREYAARQLRRVSAEDLDGLLKLQPGRDGEDALAYRDAINAGRVGDHE